MDTPELLTLAHAALGALVAWAGCRLWYGRKLRILTARAQKIHADRETLQEQVKQARLQLGQVQQDLTTRIKADTAAARQRATTPAQEKAQAEAKARLQAQLAIPSGVVLDSAPAPLNGFADTMPFEEN
ncbi:MAG: hypothetical protein ABIX46_14610 [Burkholderiaceae bacterium]